MLSLPNKVINNLSVFLSIFVALISVQKSPQIASSKSSPNDMVTFTKIRTL